MMRKLLLKQVSIFAILCCFLTDMTCGLFAQNRQGMSVLSFVEDPTDMTANLQGTTLLDQNGDKCALIKIRTTESGFVFDTGMMGVIDVQYDAQKHPGEIWLYVPFGIKKLSIQHSVLGSVDYPITIQIQRAHTYLMELTTDRVITTVQKRANSQYVIFKVFPEDAVVILNRKVLKTENGCAWDYVKFGKYEWKVVGGQYYLPQTGTVTVKDFKEPVNEEVRLQPAFGTVNFPGTAAGVHGASIYIDGVRMGKVPLAEARLMEGRHEIVLVKDKFQTVQLDLTIARGESRQIDPEMPQDSRPVELLADYGARIYVDGVDCGLSSWKGELSSGVHLVSTSKENHTSSEQALEITSSRIPVHFKLDSPVMKTGSIRIKADVDGSADVFIDGKKCGKTPYYNSSIGVGEHRISINSSEYFPYYETVYVYEGRTSEVTASLKRSVNVILSSNVENATFVIDGKYSRRVGDVAGLDVGSHEVSVSAVGYRRRTQKVNVEKNTDEIKVLLKHKISVSGGIGINVGGIPNSSVICVNRSETGVNMGLPAYFSIGNASNFFNLRINVTPSFAAWEEGDPIIFCPISVGTRIRMGQSGANFFLEPEFGYNLTNDNSSTAFFGGKLGIGLGIIDFNIGAYWSCLDDRVYVGQIQPLYWALGMVFNFNNK